MECPTSSHETCCYDSQTYSDLKNQTFDFDSICVDHVEAKGWKQGTCPLDLQTQLSQCGHRNFEAFNYTFNYESNPHEFPWACLLIGRDPSTNQTQLFGSCVIVPDNKNNDISQGTNRVITTPHILKLQPTEELIVRIMEFDRIETTEAQPYEDYTVCSFKMHDNFNGDDARLRGLTYISYCPFQF